MHSWVTDIRELVRNSGNFRQVMYTGSYSQLTIMNIGPEEDAGKEVHKDTDQFICIESGRAHLTLGHSKDEVDETHELEEGWAAFIPAGAWHNIINTGTEELKLFSLYSPVLHPRDIVHATKEEDLRAQREKDRMVTMGMAGADGFGA